MNRLAPACLLLSLCSSISVANPVPQGNRETSGASKCSAALKECKESLNEFKDAAQFMELKAAVFADLSRLEEPAAKKPKATPERDAKVIRRKVGTAPVYSAIEGPNGKASAPTTSTIQPVSLKSEAETVHYKLNP
jgi:hypothetical protein